MKLIIEIIELFQREETNARKFSNDGYPLTDLHCVCAIDADTGYEYTYKGDSLDAGLFIIYAADELIGHNIESKIKVLQTWSKCKLPTNTRTFCTYRHAKSMFPGGFREDRILNLGHRGSNSLEAWSYRLGVYKAKPRIDWSKQDPPIASYCMQNCQVTLALYKFLKRRLRWGVLSPIIELCSTR